MLTICPSVHQPTHHQALLCTRPCVRTSRDLGSKQSSLLPLGTCTWKVRWTHGHTHTATWAPSRPRKGRGNLGERVGLGQEADLRGGGIELSALKVAHSSASFAEQVRTGLPQPPSPRGSPPRSHRILGKFRLSFVSTYTGCEAQMGTKNVPGATWPVEPCHWIYKALSWAFFSLLVLLVLTSVFKKISSLQTTPLHRLLGKKCFQGGAG